MARASVRAVVAGGLLLLAAATGCSCETVHCRVPRGPEFGAGTREFLADVADLPEWAAEEIDVRSDRLGEFGQRFWARRVRETQLTRDRIVGLGPAIAEDFEEHGGSLLDFLGRQGDRVNEDACCFFERTWHTIKLVARP